ncbi:hypothetical protein EW145_g8414 [Phellinidium pouzarii]|uniref:Uncharacterized protein n=1 Tax=Phellinidium pouzarii TaxID=167371 RepID=A0A4S4K670_9AGAM|nr:hypothetical protein EW145_g8414 [Phellinidium pouzarii]
MYFGTFAALEGALDAGQVRWTDVVRNVEYLGMRTRVKSFLGRWYARRADAAGGACFPPVVCAEDYDAECYPYKSDFDSDDDDDDDDDCSSCSDSDSGADSDYGAGSDCCMSDTDDSLESIMEEAPAVDAVMKQAGDDLSKDTDMMDKYDPPRGRTRTRNSPNVSSHSPMRRRNF